uniref:Uncharacterized protein n=1 Tax=Oryza punctata TaxID=4537 RepID=A0A0E0L1Z8_ORYPU
MPIGGGEGASHPGPDAATDPEAGQALGEARISVGCSRLSPRPAPPPRGRAGPRRHWGTKIHRYPQQILPRYRNTNSICFAKLKTIGHGPPGKVERLGLDPVVPNARQNGCNCPVAFPGHARASLEYQGVQQLVAAADCRIPGVCRPTDSPISTERGREKAQLHRHSNGPKLHGPRLNRERLFQSIALSSRSF